MRQEVPPLFLSAIPFRIRKRSNSIHDLTVYAKKHGQNLAAASFVVYTVSNPEREEACKWICGHCIILWL